jgi:tRNA threonylcarbamoyladenosine biosynthesis protein TsaE
MQQATSSSEDTVKLGNQIAANLKGGDVVLLHGDLGAGKTTLVKGIAEYFDIEPNDVVSPTFTLMQVYSTVNDQQSTIKQLVHIDTYRLEDEDELIEIGAEDYLGDENTVCLVEWPEKLDTLLNNIRPRRTRLGRGKILNINIEHVRENERRITVT